MLKLSDIATDLILCEMKRSPQGGSVILRPPGTVFLSSFGIGRSFIGNWFLYGKPTQAVLDGPARTLLFDPETIEFVQQVNREGIAAVFIKDRIGNRKIGEILTSELPDLKTVPRYITEA